MTRAEQDANAAHRLLPDANWRQSLRRSLLAWYAKHQRQLPWRESRDPYRIWVSEIMLQQTQVATVKSYFERFVQRFQTVADLAEADEPEVLRYWEGLGYYRRARQMHQAARVIMADHDGQFPGSLPAIQSLPGIGRYTAGAIVSIAFDQPAPILEANTIRLYSRLLAYRDDPRRADGQRLLWQFAEAILPRRQVGHFNQALMELGSEVCRPRAPLCEHCPLARLCPTQAHGLQDEIPVAAAKTRYEDAQETAVVVWRGSQVLLRRCADGERWAGLWDFPRFRNEPSLRGQGEVTEQLRRLAGIDAEVGELMTTIKHAVTRFRITLTCYRAAYRAGEPPADGSYCWVDPATLHAYPLSVTGRKLSHLLQDNHRK
jgi:A/G-specific adenine glycosylase